jgi:hypothetical protein
MPEECHHKNDRSENVGRFEELVSEPPTQNDQRQSQL